MSSFLVLSLTGLASISVLLAVTGIVLFRADVRALAYWLFGWSSLLLAAFVTLILPHYPEISPISPLFSSFVAPFMLLGAYAHAERSEPVWPFAAGFLLGITRASCDLLGVPARVVRALSVEEQESIVANAARYVSLKERHRAGLVAPLR